MDYQETNREDFNAENIQCDEIPVATVTDEEANRLIPADAAADDENYLMITFGKPYDFEGETFKGIDLSGLENIKGRQLTAIEKAFGKTIRIFPHKMKGEGHFAAVLEKDGECQERFRGACKNGVQRGLLPKDYQEFTCFAEQNLKGVPEGIYLRFGEQLYLAPVGTPSLAGLKVLRPGLHLGAAKKNRFEPAHALALAFDAAHTKNSFALSSKEKEAARFIEGQTFAAEGEKGWYLITVDGYSLGWGKLAGGIMKNHYPKGLRKNIF